MPRHACMPAVKLFFTLPSFCAPDDDTPSGFRGRKIGSIGRFSTQGNRRAGGCALIYENTTSKAKYKLTLDTYLRSFLMISILEIEVIIYFPNSGRR